MDKEQMTVLVKKAQNGDGAALNELFNTHYNDVYYFALKTVKDSTLAQDITQEAFIEIINTIGNLKEPAAFMSWVKQITYHRCTAYFKKKKDIILDENEDGDTVFDTIKEENTEFIPDEALDNKELKRIILLILDQLSEEQRSAVMMYYFDELSVGEIAAIQGVSEGTVKSRLNYARKTIKTAIEDYEKKNNIKLHAIPFFPFMGWIFSSSKQTLSASAAKSVAKAITATTGTSVAVGTVGSSVAAGAILTKVIAGIAATAVITGGVIGGIAIANNANDTKDNGSIVQDTESSTSIPSPIQKTDNFKSVGIISHYEDFLTLKNHTIAGINKLNGANNPNRESVNGEGFNYPLVAPLSALYNNIYESYISNGYGFIRYDNPLPDTYGFYIQYKIPCENEKAAEELIRRDFKEAYDFMNRFLNNNSPSTQWPSLPTDSDFESAGNGAYVLLLNFYEQVPYGIGAYNKNSFEFRFACEEIDGQLYYCPKVVLNCKEVEEDGTWGIICRTGLKIMEY